MGMSVFTVVKQFLPDAQQSNQFPVVLENATRPRSVRGPFESLEWEYHALTVTQAPNCSDFERDFFSDRPRV